MSIVLTFLAGLAGDWFKDWKAGRENQRAVEKAVTDNRIRLAESEQTHNQEWEMRALEGRDAFLRRASFTAWSAPLLWAYFDPTGAALYFSQSLGALPDWYVGGYLAITGAVWGVSELKAAGAWNK
jgi:hypothetical protein